MSSNDPKQGSTPPPRKGSPTKKPGNPAPIARPSASGAVPVHPAQAIPVTPIPVDPVPVQPIPVQPIPVQSVEPNPRAAAPKPTPVSPLPVGETAAPSVAPKPVPVQPVPVKPVARASRTPVPVSRPAKPIPVAAPTEDEELEMVGTGPDDLNESDEETEADVERLKKSAPPWLVSTVLHMVILLIVGWVFLPAKAARPVEIEAAWADVEGEQLDDTVDLIADDDIAFEDDSFSDELVLDPVDDPLSSPIATFPDMNATGVSPTFVAPTVGAALNGRTPGMKAGLLKAYGGTKKTEKSVASGLGWLKKNINKKTGGWSLVGSYKDGGQFENETAATAMAILAFQGAGHTPYQGNYRAEMARAWKFLLSKQSDNGKFELSKESLYSHSFYTHGQATIALCELYAMSGKQELREPAQRAVDYFLKTQGSTGGWRYRPKDKGDLSVTGWGVMALQSARMGGLNVPEEDLDRIRRFLDDVSVEESSKYRYLPNDPPTPTMTAEGLLCRQYLGWSHDEPALLAGTEYISKNPIQWREPDHYYWYYATQVMHHMEGQLWEDWNNVMREEIPDHQVQNGDEAGSWFDDNDRWSLQGGRMYTTCLSMYMLEVYYRHLPLYNSVYNQ